MKNFHKKYIMKINKPSLFFITSILFLPLLVEGCMKNDTSSSFTPEKINFEKTDETNSIENSDTATSETIQNPYYSNDVSNVYYKNKILEGANVNDFQVLEAGYAKDNRLVYHMGEPLPQFDAPTFYVFSEQPQYVKDKNGAYQYGKIIQGSDADSFVVLGNTLGDIYTKDKNYVYCLNTSRLQEANSASFQQIPSTPYGTDANHVFYDCEVLKGADPKTFRVVNYRYVADKYYVWEVMYDAELEKSFLSIVKNANPDTFDY